MILGIDSTRIFLNEIKDVACFEKNISRLMCAIIQDVTIISIFRLGSV